MAVQRALRGTTPTGQILTGLRGVGKTVLLNHLAMMAEDAGGHAVMLEVPEDGTFLSLLAAELEGVASDMGRQTGVVDRLWRMARALRIGVEAGLDHRGAPTLGLRVEMPIEQTPLKGDLRLDLRDVFIALGTAAKEQGTIICIALDELQFLKQREFEALILATHRATQKQLPIVVLGAGLPTLPALAGEAKTYAERAFEEIGALSPSDVANAIREPARQRGADFTDEAIARIATATHGYPYFVQRWASDAWVAASKSPVCAADVDRATPGIERQLDRSFFRVRFDRCTPREQQYLRAMAELGPGEHSAADIASVLKMHSSASVGSLRESLARKGMIYIKTYGITGYTVPLFDEYIRRAMPELKLSARSRTKALRSI